MALTSREQRAGFPLSFKLESASLPKESWVKISQVRTLSVRRLGHRIGRITAEEMAILIDGLNELVSG